MSNQQVPTESKSIAQRAEEKGIHSIAGAASAERAVENRDKEITNSQKREDNVEQREEEALREADEKVESAINEHIIDRTQGLSKQSAGQGVMRSQDYFIQSHDQKQLVGGYSSHILGSDYLENTENLSRGRTHSYAPIPQPPVNQFNMFPQNQFPVDMYSYVHPTTLERDRYQPGYSSMPEGVDIQPDPAAFGLGAFSFPDIQKTVHDGIETAEMVNATPPFSEIVHPLNKRFTATDDPYNQNGKNFRQSMGFDQGDTLMKTNHITGELSSVVSNSHQYRQDGQAHVNNETRLIEEDAKQRAAEVNINEANNNDPQGFADGA